RPARRSSSARGWIGALVEGGEGVRRHEPRSGHPAAAAPRRMARDGGLLGAPILDDEGRTRLDPRFSRRLRAAARSPRRGGGREAGSGTGAGRGGSGARARARSRRGLAWTPRAQLVQLGARLAGPVAGFVGGAIRF